MVKNRYEGLRGSELNRQVKIDTHNLVARIHNAAQQCDCRMALNLYNQILNLATVFLDYARDFPLSECLPAVNEIDSSLRFVNEEHGVLLSVFGEEYHFNTCADLYKRMEQRDLITKRAGSQEAQVPKLTDQSKPL